MSFQPSLSRFVLVAICGLAGAASAQERPWYVTADAGLSRTGTPDFAGGRLTTSQGQAFGGAIGRHLGANWRVEAAVMYRNNGVDSLTSPGFDPRPADADWASVFLTVNAFHDFDAFKWGRANVRPYLGLGIGRAQEVDTDLTAGGAPREFSGSASGRQFMTGLRWDYGSPWVADFGLALTQSGKIRLAPTGVGTAVEAKYRTTSLVARLGYRF